MIMQIIIRHSIINMVLYSVKSSNKLSSFKVNKTSAVVKNIIIIIIK